MKKGVAIYAVLSIFLCAAFADTDEIEKLESEIQNLNKQVAELRNTVKLQKVEIERLKALCLDAGIDISPTQKTSPQNIGETPKKRQIDINEVEVMLRRAIEEVQKKRSSFEKEQFLAGFVKEFEKKMKKNFLTMTFSIQDIAPSNNHTIIYVGRPKGLPEWHSDMWVGSGYKIHIKRPAKLFKKWGIRTGEELIFKTRARLNVEYGSKRFGATEGIGLLVLQFDRDDIFLRLEVDPYNYTVLIKDKRFRVSTVN